MFDSGKDGLEKGNCYFPFKKGTKCPQRFSQNLGLFDLVLRQILVGVRVSDELPKAINSEIVKAVTNDVTGSIISFFLLLICSFFAQIVEAAYEPVPPGQYSDKVSETVSR